MGAGSTPGTGQTAGQSAGFAQTSSVSCISQRQGQTVPKGHFLCSQDWKSTRQLLQLFRGQLDTRCVWGVWLIAEAPGAEPECDMRGSEELDQTF